MLIKCRARIPASDMQVAIEVARVLEQRAAMTTPPPSLTVPDAVALGIADTFRGPTPAGQVMDRLCWSRAVDGGDLIQAARFEQGFATLEGHAALHCLIGWAQARLRDAGRPVS